jgi:protein-disulfide isomerase
MAVRLGLWRLLTFPYNHQHLVARRSFLRGILQTLVGGLLLALVQIGPASALSLEEMMSAGSLGNDKASVTVVEYASLTCPHCAHFANEVFPAFRKKYVDSGKVHYIFKDYPLDQLGMHAAMMARCGGPEHYFGYIEVLYRTQESWATAKDPMDALEKIAIIGGLPKDQFDACMQNKALTDAILQGRLEAEDKYKVDSTPTFIINGEPHSGFMPLEEFDKILEPLLRKGS